MRNKHTPLPDVNVLVALFDPAHPNHEEAHQWFRGSRKKGWATCPLTVNGCVRVLSNPSYPSFQTRPAEVISRLRQMCSSSANEFWPDEVSLLDESLFDPHFIAGHRDITDVYLLGLAVRRGGSFVTFDRSISVSAVLGAESRHLHVLG